MFELARADSLDLLDLRRELDLDPGYLTRLVKRLEKAGLVEIRASRADRRRKVLSLTDRGRETFEDLDGRAAAHVEEMLTGLGEPDQARLVSALTTILELLGPNDGHRPYVLRPPRPGDFGWVVQRHGALYAQEYGWDESFEGLVARVVADYIEERDPKREEAWVADFDGDPVGCVFCTKEDDRTARLRLLLVEPKARGMGVGARLVDECVRFARRAGYDRLVLWTNDVLVSARRIYEAAGFRLVAENAHRSFGHDLKGQDWILELGQHPT